MNRPVHKQVTEKQIKYLKSCENIRNKTCWITAHKSFILWMSCTYNAQKYMQNSSGTCTIYLSLFLLMICQAYVFFHQVMEAGTPHWASEVLPRWFLCFRCIIKCANVNSPKEHLLSGIYKVHQECLNFFIWDGMVQHSPWFTRAIYQDKHLLPHIYQPRSLFHLVLCHIPWFSNFHYLSTVSS